MLILLIFERSIRLMPSETLNEWERHNELEKTILTGIYGQPEIKRAEKNRFLGEFRERVIKRLSKKQVAEPGIYPEITSALEDENAKKMVIHGDIPYSQARKYEKLAHKLQKGCSIIHEPGFKGDTGLLVVSGNAVDIENIDVEDRTLRLTRLGVPEPLIHSAGRKVCKSCLDKMLKADPAEASNYTMITFLDHLWGEHCPVCSSKEH